MKLLKRLLKNETGQVLPIALILLVLGGLLVVPTLGLMSTNLTANTEVDQSNLELYAADAGVEEVLWNVNNNQEDFQLPPDNGETVLPEALDVNGKLVNAKLTKLPGEPYKIISTATSGDGHRTTVECYIDVQADLSWFFDAAITGQSTVTLKPGTVVEGEVVYGQEGGIDNKGTIIDTNGDNDGQAEYNPDLQDNWPSAAYLTSYYAEQVEDAATVNTGYIINVNGHPATNQYSVWNGGPLHALGNLNISGTGWARLDGVLFVEGDLQVAQNVTVNLNGQTIFTTGTIDFKPGSTITGSGCIIAVGDIYFAPRLGAGEKFIGVEDDSTINGQAPSGTFILTKFTAEVTGDVQIFTVNCNNTGNVKVAMYADSGGEPGNLLNAVSESQEVVGGWNNIDFPLTHVVAGTDYWLAVNSSANIINYLSTTVISRTKSASYCSFIYPDPAGTGFSAVTNKEYLLAGHGRPFVFAMSIDGTSDIKPNGTWYGSIAGSAEVELYPKCSLTLTAVPGDGLNFPGMNLGDDEEHSSGLSRTITYTIKTSTE
jgi:hypothetical protein